MCVLIFSADFVRNISQSKKNLARHNQNIYSSSCKVPVTLMKRVCSRQIFEKYSDIILMKIRLVGAELYRANRREDRRTDGDDEANLRFPQFFERA